MTERNRDLSNLIVAAVIVFGFFIWCIFKPADDYSYTERRNLASLPKLSLDGSYMDSFEKYATDQFPMRENFRTFHAQAAKYLFGRKEINNIYIADGHISKLDYVVNGASVDWSLSRMQLIKDLYLENNETFLCIIPDKNYFLGPQSGYPYLDYDKFVKQIYAGMDFANFIYINDKLSLDSYYYTDLHWRQETLIPVAETISEALGDSYDFDFTVKDLGVDFKGVYYGQAAVDMPGDSVKYLSGDYMDSLIVNCYDSGAPEEIGVYNFDKAEGLDAYEVFLSGPKALITIENPLIKEKKELVIFRDSFGSSFAPLLAGNYSKITLVDIRYMSPKMVGRFVDFEDAQVLFLFSSQVLNNSVGQFLN